MLSLLGVIFPEISDLGSLFLQISDFPGNTVHFCSFEAHLQNFPNQSDQFSGFSEYFPPFRKNVDFDVFWA